MKRQIQRIIASITALAAVICSLSLSGTDFPDMLTEKAEAATYGVFEYKIQDGNAIITGCDQSASGTVAIPATIEGYPVTGIDYSSFSRCENITEFVIPESVKIIGSFALAFCEKITVDERNQYFSSDEFGVLFDKNKTMLFQYPIKSQISSYVIPDGVEEISWYAIAGTNLINVTIPESVKSISQFAFAFNNSIENFFIPKNVKTIEFNAFACCNGISVDEDNQYFSSDENGILYNKNKSYLYQYPTLSSKTEFEVPDCVETIYPYAFYLSKNLISINIPGSVKGIGWYAFGKCINLSDVSLNKGLTSIGKHAFYDCKSLLHITLPDSIRFIDGFAFENCNLETVYYPNTPSRWNNMLRIIPEGNDALLNAELKFLFEIRKPSTTEINYGDSLLLHADINEALPEGSYVGWKKSDKEFDMIVSEDGLTCEITPRSSGKTLFTATIYDKDGNSLYYSDEILITANAGIWQRIVAFFKNIFGMTKIIPESLTTLCK